MNEETKPLIQHGTAYDARKTFMESLDEATSEQKSWMAAIWSVENGKLKLVQVTTYSFPNGDMLAATGMLALRLHETVFIQSREIKELPTVFPDQWMKPEEPDSNEENTNAEDFGIVEDNDLPK